MLPQAMTVRKDVPPVTRGEPAMRVLGLLREHGVAVLVDEQRRPFDILTSCDLDKVRKQVEQGLKKDSPAEALFAKQGREVHTVNENDDLTLVAQRIVKHGLATGIVVVDRMGRYAGYVFTSDLRDTADRFAKETSEDARRVQARYPEAWSSLRSRLPS